jgi:triacylglycerol lipase
MVFSIAGLSAPAASADECVILLHGLARGPRSMNQLGNALEEAGFEVANVAYASRQHSIPTLSRQAVAEGLARCPDHATVHFVTHSMGGILVRHYLASSHIDRLGRVVMLAPPNQGSEVVDRLRENSLFRKWFGPAAGQLGTNADGLVAGLGPVDFDLGVIAGTRSSTPLFSAWLPDTDDGRVALAATRVEGMRDFIALPFSHRAITRKQRVIEQVVLFIRQGRFQVPDS